MSQRTDELFEAISNSYQKYSDEIIGDMLLTNSNEFYDVDEALAELKKYIDKLEN